jgi:predicted permease
MSDILRAFFILLVGMSLTFFGIFLIWGLMVILKRIYKGNHVHVLVHSAFPTSTKLATVETKNLAVAASIAYALINQRTLQAASAAVSTLMAAQATGSSQKEQSLPAMSSWLVTHRLEQINLRNQIYNRKSRGEHS